MLRLLSEEAGSAIPKAHSTSNRRKQAGDKEKCFSAHKFFIGNGFQSGHLSEISIPKPHSARSQAGSPNFITVVEKAPFK